MSTAEGAYRCAECKSWRHLMAWATGIIEGPLNERGELTAYDYVDDCGLQEDSIRCTRHIDAGIELFHAGRWCRWWSCSRCKGEGLTGRHGDQYRYQCPDGIPTPAGWSRYMGYGKIHKGWLPAREVAALLSAEKIAS